MAEKSLVELIENAAEAREDPRIPRDYICNALGKIERNEVEIERYPTGQPSLKAVYDVAFNLYMHDRSKYISSS